MPCPRERHRGLDPIGGTTGISHAGNAFERPCRSILYGIHTEVATPVIVPSTHRVAAMCRAAVSPMTSLPSNNVPAPTVSMAIGGAP